MSQIFPAEPPPGTPKSELKVRERLTALTGITSLHSVAWQGIRNGRQADGEADFVVCVENKGVLILEVKGGTIEVENGKWFTTGASGERSPIKNPFEQAKDSKYALLSFLKSKDVSLQQLPIVHAVVFPDISITKDMGMFGPRQIVIDRNDLSSLEISIERIFDHWGQAGPLGKLHVERLVALLVPSISINKTISDEIEEQSTKILRLTQEQIDTLQMLRRVRNALITGGAGTGKTLLAIEKARQVSIEGGRVLLLCFNTPLRDYLRTQIRQGLIEIETFHSLVVTKARSNLVKLPFELTTSWYEHQAPEILRSLPSDDRSKYDAIIIDEAQDFSRKWIDALVTLKSEQESLLYLFADSHQVLYQRDWGLTAELPIFELHRNCRNTDPIAKRVKNIFSDNHMSNGVNGPEPTFIEVARPQLMIGIAIELIGKLLTKEGLRLNQLAILSDSRDICRLLKEETVSGQSFGDLGSKGITVETIHRFKGLERDVVVVIASEGINAENAKPMIYVALSRARHSVFLIANPSLKSEIHWQ